MPDLYRLCIGPVNAAYYQKHFQRFEVLGKAVPTWNNGAAFFTLAWLLLRKLWRPAAIYAGLVALLLLLWWFGLHGRIPLPAEAAICLIGVLLLCVLPGFLGNALYYQHIRNQTLQTLGKATSLAQACVILTNEAATKERLQITATVQGLVCAAIAAWVLINMDLRATAPAAPIASGPPDIVIPSVESLRAKELQAFTPDVALPAQDEPALDFQPMVAPPAPKPSAEAPSAKPAEPELSIVEFAQAVPAAGSRIAAAPPAATAPAAAPANATVASAEKKAPATPTAAPAAKTPVSASAIAAIGKEAPAKKTVAAKPAERADPHRLIPGKFYLNAGVYAQTTNVASAVKRLQSAKLHTLQQTVHSNKGELTRLRIGPFDTREQAQQAAAKGKQLRIETSVFQQPKP